MPGLLAVAGTLTGAGTMAGSGTWLFAVVLPEPGPVTPHRANPPSTAAATIQARTGCLILVSRCRKPRGRHQSGRSGKAMWIVSSGPSRMFLAGSGHSGLRGRVTTLLLSRQVGHTIVFISTRIIGGRPNGRVRASHKKIVSVNADVSPPRAGRVAYSSSRPAATNARW